MTFPSWEIDEETLSAADLVEIAIAGCADSGRDRFVEPLCELAALLAALDNLDNVEPELDIRPETLEFTWEDDDECWDVAE